MNTTRILVLTIGLVSALAVAGMQTRVLGQSPAINDKNWQTSPKIIAIRKIVNSDTAAVSNGTFKTEHRICEEGWFSRLRIARDAKGTVRWYQHYQEGEDTLDLQSKI